MKQELAEKIGQGLSDIRVNHGVDPLDEPRRSVAILADLIGDPHLDSSVQIEAIRVALDHVGNLSERERSAIAAEDLVSYLVDRSISRSTAVEIVPLIADATDLRFGTKAASSADRRWLAGVAVLVLAAAGTWLALRGSNAADPMPTPTSTTSATATSTSTMPTTTTQPTSQPGVVATFPQVREGSFLVTRGWRVTPGGSEVIGIILLEPAGEDGISAQHRELAPTTPIPDASALSWQPEPAATINNVAVFNVELAPGESLQIEFRSALESDVPIDEITVLGWFETWRSQSAEIRPLGASDELLEPVVTVGG